MIILFVIRTYRGYFSSSETTRTTSKKAEDTEEHWAADVLRPQHAQVPCDAQVQRAERLVDVRTRTRAFAHAVSALRATLPGQSTRHSLKARRWTTRPLRCPGRILDALRLLQRGGPALVVSLRSRTRGTLRASR